MSRSRWLWGTIAGVSAAILLVSLGFPPVKLGPVAGARGARSSGGRACAPTRREDGRAAAAAAGVARGAAAVGPRRGENLGPTSPLLLVHMLPTGPRRRPRRPSRRWSCHPRSQAGSEARRGELSPGSPPAPSPAALPPVPSGSVPPPPTPASPPAAVAATQSQGTPPVGDAQADSSRPSRRGL